MWDEELKRLLTGCLREKHDEYLAESLLKEFPTIQQLMNAQEAELRQIAGMNLRKARQLLHILNFARYCQTNPAGKRFVIRAPEDVFAIVRGELEYETVEKFLVLGLNTKNYIQMRHIVSVGSLSASIVHPRETFKLLIKRGCASAILVHNHPSGDPTPSHEDIALTKQLMEAGKILAIPVMDHVIVGQGKYASLKEKGLL